MDSKARSHPEELVGGEVEAGNALLVLERQLVIGAVHSPNPTIVSNVLPGWEDAILPIFFAFEADPKSLVLVNLEWLKKTGFKRVKLVLPSIAPSPDIHLFHSSATNWL